MAVGPSVHKGIIWVYVGSSALGRLVPLQIPPVCEA